MPVSILNGSPFASLRENAGLSRCSFPPLRSGRTRGTKPTASRRLSPALGRVLCQFVKTMHSTFEGPQSLAEEIAMVYNIF